MKRQGGWLLAKTLYDMGIRDIFSLAGGHINPIYKACSDLGIRLIDTHHEQGASMAADAYGRSTRSPGVCLVTAGPGLTNAITGLAGSYLSNSPMLLISGRSGIEENDRLSLQEIDQLAMVRPITKWARNIYDINRIPEYVSRAFKISLTGRPGPVYLGVSYEVLYPQTRMSGLSSYDISVPDTSYEPKDTETDDLLKLLQKAKKPITILGSGSWYSGCEGDIKEFMLKLNVPTFTLNMGRGIVPDKNCFGAASPSSPKGFREISSKADLILLLGIRPSIYMGFGNTFNEKAKVVQVDIDPEEISRNVKADMSIVADLRSFILKMNDGMNKRTKELSYRDWNDQAEQIKNSTYKDFQKKVLSSRKKAVHPAKVAKVVSDLVKNDGIAVVDGGDCQSWTDVTYQVENPGHYIKGGPLGCMGVGIPFALGTKAANPDKNVVLITGDGAAAMNFMEIETAVKHHLPFVVVVCNDSAWGMTKHQIEITYPEFKKMQGVDLGFVRLDKIAEALGGHGEMVTEITKLEPALKRALKSDRTAVINVQTDPKAVSGATRFITEMMMKGM